MGGGAMWRDASGLRRHARQDRSDQRAEIFEAMAQRRQQHLEAGEARVEVLGRNRSSVRRVWVAALTRMSTLTVALAPR